MLLDSNYLSEKLDSKDFKWGAWGNYKPNPKAIKHHGSTKREILNDSLEIVHWVEWGNILNENYG